MEHKLIKRLAVEDRIEQYFVVRKCDIREGARGKYAALELGDSSGRIDGRFWEPDQFTLFELKPGMIVKLRGQVSEYQDKLQITVHKVRPSKPDEYNIADLLATSTQSKEERRARILTLTEKIENTYIKQLIESFWRDTPLFERYLTSAASKLWHHAYIGGLSEHSANVTEMTLRVASGYEWLKRDYLIFGGLLHDVGKIDTYTESALIDFTDAGRLVGHIVLADHWVCDRAAKIDGFPETLLTKLRHMLLSHQGELANQSPVVPMLPEAFILYYCDEIDAKMGAIDRIRSRQQEAGWSEWINLMERYLYFEELPKRDADS